jgi:hypothetical protein
VVVWAVMADERTGPRRVPIASDGDDQPLTHPTRQATVLLVAVTLLIVALAIVSSYDVL